MLGLGAYASDSEDDELPSNQQQQQPKSESISNSEAKPAEAPIAEVNQEAAADKNKPIVGPFRPSDSRPASPVNNATSPSRKLSPFSANRTLIHDMTLPPAPNLDIPPSPPGSPNPAANQKFAHFLSLKKQGVHFNEKLAGSASLKNPSLLPKLMSHAGIDEQAQYATSLPAELWDMSALPSWGYKEELNRSQQEIRRKIEEKKASGQREAIDFVSASGESSRTGTPSSGKMRTSAAERVMAGLSGEKKDSPSSSDQGRRPRKKRSRSR